MVERDDIQRFVDRVVDAFAPEQVVMFGSYAYGVPTQDSDVDLLVVMPRGPAGAAQAARMRQECRPAFPLDLLVRTRSEVTRRLRWRDYFLMDVMEKGVSLYDASRSRMAGKGRG